MRKEWYALQVMAGRENSVRARVLDQLQRSDALRYVDEVAVPATTIVEMKGTERVEREQRLMPGYILVHADWFSAGGILLSVQGVRGFVGQGDEPVPMQISEVQRLLGRRAQSRDSRTAPVKVGDEVRITDGPLTDFSGEVTDVDIRGQQATVQVQIFGRATPTIISWRHLVNESEDDS